MAGGDGAERVAGFDAVADAAGRKGRRAIARGGGRERERRIGGPGTGGSGGREDLPGLFPVRAAYQWPLVFLNRGGLRRG